MFQIENKTSKPIRVSCYKNIKLHFFQKGQPMIFSYNKNVFFLGYLSSKKDIVFHQVLLTKKTFSLFKNIDLIQSKFAFFRKTLATISAKNYNFFVTYFWSKKKTNQFLSIVWIQNERSHIVQKFHVVGQAGFSFFVEYRQTHFLGLFCLI